MDSCLYTKKDEVAKRSPAAQGLSSQSSLGRALPPLFKTQEKNTNSPPKLFHNTTDRFTTKREREKRRPQNEIKNSPRHHSLLDYPPLPPEHLHYQLSYGPVTLP